MHDRMAAPGMDKLQMERGMSEYRQDILMYLNTFMFAVLLLRNYKVI